MPVLLDTTNKGNMTCINKLLLLFLVATTTSAATVYDIISAHPRLKTLTTALKAAKLNTVLQGTGTFTVFAPVDEAFLTGNMQSYKLKYLLDPENMDNLKTLLTYHVLPESRTTSELTNDETLKTIDGQNLFVEKNVTSLVIHDITCAKAEVLDKDLMATNGVVQVVSETFVPEGVFCPDVIFAAEQREQARISYYGYDCRKKATKHLTDQEATKPVGLTVDKKTQQVFWSNDEDYPHGAATSWLSKATFDGTINTHFVKNIIDPQGMYVIVNLMSCYTHSPTYVKY